MSNVEARQIWYLLHKLTYDILIPYHVANACVYILIFMCALTELHDIVVHPNSILSKEEINWQVQL